MNGIGVGLINSRKALLNQVGDIPNSVTVRASSRTVSGYATGAVIADGQSLLTVPDNVGAYPGLRLLGDNTWSRVDTSGAVLPYSGQSIADAATNLLWDSANPATQTQPVVSGSHTLQVIGAGDAIVSSGLATLTDEAFTSDLDVAVSLSFDSIVAASYTVTSADGLTTYTDTTDYTVDLALGTITVISTGTMLGATGYLISYDTTHNYTGEVLVTEGAPNTLTVTAPGTLTIIVTDLLDYFQFETGTLETPMIITPIGATASRAADNVTIPTPSVLTPQQGAIEMVLTPDTNKNVVALFSMFEDANNRLLVYRDNISLVSFYKIVSGVSEFSSHSMPAEAIGVRYRSQFYWDAPLGIMGIRSIVASDDITLISFSTNIMTGVMPMTPTAAIGHQVGDLIFNATYEDPIFYASLAEAQRYGW